MAGSTAVPGGTVTLTNIGRVFTGDLDDPTADITSIRVEDGVIVELGSGSLSGPAPVLDVQGMTVAAGLIDSHSHVTFGDYTLRQDTVGFLAKYVHGAVVQVVSAGEIHVPNRPRDPEGIKALAKLAAKSWEGFRPNGMKVNAGVVLLGPGLTRADMDEVAAYGVRLAKFGFAVYTDRDQAAQDVRAARDAGLVVVSHSGGPTAADGVPVDADLIRHIQPDVAGHVNGGPTSLDDEGVARLVRETEMALQLVQAGNLRSSLMIVEFALAAGAERRLVLGTDTPTGTGVMPLGLLKTVAELSSLGGVPPERVWAWGSGNVADTFRLQGGRIAVGQPADLVVIDAPLGSYADDAAGALRRGDIPAVVMSLIDGVVRAAPSNYSPRARTTLRIEE